MKRKYLLLTIIAGFSFMLLSSAATEEEKYYYAFGDKVPLITKENTLLVKFADGADKTKAEELIKTGISSGYKEKWHNAQTVEITIDSEKTINALRTKLEASNEVYTCQPFYTLKDGLDMGVSDEVLIRFLPGISGEQKEKLFKSLEVEVIKTTKIYQKLKVKKGADALDIANKIYESGIVEFSTPNFISYAELHQVIPNDTYFNRQITCNNTGQTFTDGHSGTSDADIDAPEAWEITTGCNDIVIAVLDQGVNSNHPDLPNSRQIRLTGSNFIEGNDNPSPGGNANHGNACAGVIAATMNNNQGIAGIAPGCRIMPIRIFDDDGVGALAELKADAIELAVDNGADILSNSWGYWTSNPNAHPVIVTAINYALSNDCVVIFSAGNTANHAGGSNGYVTFPANVNISGVVTVGASDRNDNQSDYSPTSSLVDIVAPSHRAYPSGISGETLEMWSIDIPGNTGYNPWPADGTHPPTTGEILPSTGTNNLAYTSRFGGTSHSCPVVAGVAALMLSVNPDLSYTDVFNIITSTANKVGGYTYTSGKCNEMGYGRVNAYDAVVKALGGPISGPSTLCGSNTAYTISTPPSGATVNWSCSSNISHISGQGTTSCVFRAYTNGSGWIKASLITANGTFEITKTVSVGLRATFSGSTTVLLNGTGTWTAYPTCGNEPYTYRWFLRKEGTGMAATMVGDESTLTLWSLPVLKSVPLGTTMEDSDDSLSENPTKQPSTRTYFRLYLRVYDANTMYETPEQRITAYGDVDLISRYLKSGENVEDITDITARDALNYEQETDYDAPVLVMSLAPNPAGEWVDITVDGLDEYGEGYRVEFVNSMSRTVKTLRLDGSYNRVSIGDLANGYYVVRIISGKDVISKILLVDN